MMRVAAALLAILALGACGETDTSEDTPIEVRSEAQDRLFDLTPVNRDIAMRRAITGAGLTCDRVTRSGYVAAWQNTDMWTATCDDGREWAIFIGADDTAQVRSCEAVEEEGAADGLPACNITRADSQGRNQPELGEVEPGSNEP